MTIINRIKAIVESAKKENRTEIKLGIHQLEMLLNEAEGLIKLRNTNTTLVQKKPTTRSGKK